MVDLFFDGKLGKSGFIRQESCDFADFLANRFGRYYAWRRARKQFVVALVVKNFWIVYYPLYEILTING